MSIINQMLRDLDARGAASIEPPAGGIHAPAKKHSPGGRMAALLVLLSMLGVAGYLVLSERMPKASKPSPPATIARHDLVSAPVVVPSPVLVETQPEPEPPPVKQAAAPEPAPVVVKSSVEPVGQMKRALALSMPAVRETPAVPVSVQAEPVIVKKVVVLSPENEAQQLFDDAQALRRTGKIDAAIGKYRQALERNPGMLNARIQLARLMQESGQADAALSLLKTGYDQQPDTGLAIAEGRLLAELGRRDEALNWLARGREGLRPADHALMGALLSQSQRHEDAVKAYQRALVADPNQGGWLLGLGLALESLGRNEEAQMAYRNALEHGEFKSDVANFLRQKLGASGR
jgi:MSHA biogenesis protein MshN